MHKFTREGAKSFFLFSSIHYSFFHAFAQNVITYHYLYHCVNSFVSRVYSERKLRRKNVKKMRNFAKIFLQNIISRKKNSAKTIKFDPVLYQFLKTGTSDRTFMGLDQILKCLGFSLYPLLFLLNSPFNLKFCYSLLREIEVYISKQL